VFTAADELRIPLSTKSVSKKEILQAKNTYSALRKRTKIYNGLPTSIPKPLKKN
jgi:hypothetical protein